MDFDKAIQKMNEFYDSEEGKKSLEKLRQKLIDEERLKTFQLERVHRLFGSNLDSIIEKIFTKYESDEYINSEYKKGYEPRRDLYYLLYDYAEIWGREATENEWEKYGNTFSADVRILGNWVFNLMIGQGSFIKVTKLC